LLQELEDNNQPSTTKQCELKQKWASYGADISSIKITIFRPPPGQQGSVTAGAMFTAGPSTYVVIGWIIGYNFNTAPDALVPYKVSCLVVTPYEPSLAQALGAHERAVRRGPDPV
jgi:hypothetical protein